MKRHEPLAAESPVPATITAATARATAWQVIVIGAGPAGAAAAIRLAARGLRVLLLDAAAMPRPKLCGCCLSVAAVGELVRLGEIRAGVKPTGRLAESPAGAAVRYAGNHRRYFAVHHARCRRVSLVVRRPWLVGSALRLARLVPAVAARVVPLVVGGAAPGKAHG